MTDKSFLDLFVMFENDKDNLHGVGNMELNQGNWK